MAKIDSKWLETSESLFQRSLETDNRRLRERLLALALVASGRSVTQVATQIGRRRQTVAEWIEKYNAGGIEGVMPGFRYKAVTALSEEEFEILKKALGECPAEHGIANTRWRSRDVVVYVKERFDKDIHAETARRYIHRLNGKMK